jgi:hypothetical protein
MSARISSGKQTEMRYLEKISPLIFFFFFDTSFLNKYKNFTTIPETRESCTRLSIYEVSNYLALDALLRKQISFSFPRTYSTLRVVPVKIYANADKEKLQILQENKGKCGVYK